MKYASTFYLFILIGLFLACKEPNAKQPTKNAVVDLTKACLDRVMAQDDSLGKARNHACETISLSETIKQYVSGLENIDYSNCPEAFVNAFKAHREAWTAMMEVTDKYPDLRGEMHDLFDELEKSEDADTFKSLLKPIWDTWALVEKEINKE